MVMPKNIPNSTVMPEKIQDESIMALFQFDMYSAAGYIAALLGFINLILFLPCIFKVIYLYVYYNCPDLFNNDS